MGLHLTGSSLTTLNNAFVRQISPASSALGSSDVAVDVAAAFADATVQEVHVAGLASTLWYSVNTTIVVPAGKVLRVPEGTRFKPTADVDVFDVREGAQLTTPMVDVSGRTFTKAAFAITGTATFGSSTQDATRVRGRVIGKTGASGEGYGLRMDAGTLTNCAIMWSDLDISIVGTLGALLQSRLPLAGTGTTWINGNTIKLLLDRTKRGLDMLRDTTGGGVDGNHIDVQYQTATGASSAFVCQGLNNKIRFTLWDWSTKVSDTAISMTFSDGTGGNEVDTNEDAVRIADTGWNNYIPGTGPGAAARRPVRYVGSPSGTTSPAKYGNQDDWLAWAGGTRTDVTVAQTTGAAPSAGALVNLFDLNAANTCSWTDATGVTVEATWSASQRGQVYGIVFPNGTSLPTSVVCQVKKSGTWTTILTVAANTAQSLQAIPLDPNTFGITGVRWVLTGFNPANTSSTIQVERIWMFEQREPGKAYAAAKVPQIDSYTTAGAYTWTKPTGAVRCDVIVLSGGSGGGSGRRGATATVRSGGAGGSGGLRVIGQFLASDLGATETVNVGAGGAGGTAITADSTDGNTGTAGAGSGFGTFGSRWVYAPGGSAGAGGTTAAATGGAAAAPGGSTGANSSSTGGAGVSGNTGAGKAAQTTAGAGGGGGGINTSNVEGAGGGGSAPVSGASTAAASGGTAAGGAGNVGTVAGANSRLPGGGGSGGGGGASGGGVGGAGGAPGGGGGGGGASLNGAASGAGGAGADGAVYVITYFV